MLSTPPSPRTLTVAVSGLSRSEADRVVEQLEAMGHPGAVVAADDGGELPNVLAVFVRQSRMGGTARLVHVVGEAGVAAEAERLAGEPGGPVLAAHAPCTWEAFRWTASALSHRQDGLGWLRLGPPAGAINTIEAVLTTAKGAPPGLVRLPVAERVAIPEVAR